MNELLTIGEICQRFDSEWVLIGDPVEDDALELQQGRVLFHSPDAEAVYRKAVELRPARFATLFTGRIPDDMEFAL